MSTQVLLTPTIITKESLVILENNLVMANRVNRKFENQFVKIGNALTIRKPNKFTVASGAGLQVQNINEPSVTITIDKQKHVDFQFTSQDLTLTVEEFSERYLKPAMASLANQVDYDVLTDVRGISNYVGTPNLNPTAFSTSVQLVGRRMDDLLDRPDLDNSPGVHDGDPIAGLCDHAHVMGDQHDCGATVMANPFQQPDNLGLNGDVERCGRLIGDDQLWLSGERQRDHDPLAHPTAELVRIVVDPFAGGGDAGFLQQFDRALTGLPFGQR
jgi:hypothetical protein